MTPTRGPRSCPRCQRPFTGTRCPTCARRARQANPRGTSSQRGYGSKWRFIRAQYLKAHPVCCLCPAASEVPDHWPVSRRDLVARGVEHPDAWEHLRPLCRSCHSKETNRNQPGGWNKR